MLVAILIGVMVLAGVHHIFVSGLTTQTTTSTQIEASADAQVAMDEMMDRLRGAYSISDLAHLNGSTTVNAIAFSDLDTSGAQRVWRYWRGTDAKLYRSLNTSGYSGGIAAATDVQQLVFDARDQNGNATATPSQAIAVVVSLTVKKGNASLDLVSRVRHRNR
jgi:Tfp pilus assembly protein PilW